MKKRLLTKINLLLGAASLGLAGCGTTKQAAPAETAVETPVETPAPPVEDVQIEPQVPEQQEPVVCKYGVPVDWDIK